MGCFGSRFDKRASGATENLNSVGLQFLGGEGSPADLLSADNFVALQMKDGKYQELTALYPTEGGKATDETGATAVFVAAYKAVERLHKEHEDEKKKSDKDGLVAGTYKLSEAIAQLANVLESFKTSGIEVPADAAPAGGDADKPAADKPAADAEADKPADDAAEGGEAEELQYDGGEDDAGAGGDAPAGDAEKTAEAMATVDPRSAHTLDATYEGFAETPALYLRNALVNEYFGDLIKQRIVAIQFQGEKGLKLNPDFAGVAGYLSSGLATSAREAKEAWFSGIMGELDGQAAGELKAEEAISFPGWVQGWGSQEDAANYLKTINGLGNVQGGSQVIFQVQECPSVSVLGNRLVAHRLSGKVTAVPKTADGITTVIVKANAYDERTLEASAAEAVAAATAGAAKTEEPKPADGDKDKPEEPKPEEPKPEGAE